MIKLFLVALLSCAVIMFLFGAGALKSAMPGLWILPGGCF